MQVLWSCAATPFVVPSSSVHVQDDDEGVAGLAILHCAEQLCRQEVYICMYILQTTTQNGSNQHVSVQRSLVHAQDGDEGVALESCEFWTAFCEAKVQPSTLRPFLGRLVPVLLKNMVYDEYDEEVSWPAMQLLCVIQSHMFGAVPQSLRKIVCDEYDGGGGEAGLQCSCCV